MDPVKWAGGLMVDHVLYSKSTTTSFSTSHHGCLRADTNTIPRRKDAQHTHERDPVNFGARAWNRIKPCVQTRKEVRLSNLVGNTSGQPRDSSGRTSAHPTFSDPPSATPTITAHVQS